MASRSPDVAGDPCPDDGQYLADTSSIHAARLAKTHPKKWGPLDS